MMLFYKFFKLKQNHAHVLMALCLPMPGAASFAEATAAFTSSTFAKPTSAIASPVAGLNTG
jgi:hypothetical protein